MSDEKGRRLERAAQAGDTAAAASAIAYGGRGSDGDLVVTALASAVANLSRDELDTALYAISEEISAREPDYKRGRETHKVGELHMPAIGNVSLGNLISEVVGFVEELRVGDKEAKGKMRPKYSQRQWRNNAISVDKQLKDAQRTLKDIDGIMVGSSSALRIYALKTMDPAKAARKIEKRKKDLAGKIKHADNVRSHQETALKHAEMEKKRLQRELDALQ